MSEQSSRLAVATLAGLGLLLLVHQIRPALSAVLPKDMPSDAKFVLTGYDSNDLEPRGHWVACGINHDHATNWCRVTNQIGTVIYQGDFLPMGSMDALPASQLKVGAYDPHKHWILGPAEQVQVPIIPLANGTILVPAADTLTLPRRWANDPHEFQMLTASAMVHEAGQ